jgi:hypothetical protein
MRTTLKLRLQLWLSLLFALWAFPFPITSFEFLSFIYEPLSDLLNKAILFFGNHVLTLTEPLEVKPSGSGDKMLDYVNLLMIFILSVLLWLGLQFFPKTSDNSALFKKIIRFCSIYLRYYLAVVLISYGLAKVFILQFQPPSYARLLTEFGNMSPMGLVWSFMGYSKGYTFMSGLLEFLGGILLFNKRTITMGCLLILVVMGNVVALNFFYDVPVKLYAVRYFAIALFIIWPRLGALTKTVFAKYPVTFNYFQNHSWSKFQPILKAAKYVFLSGFVGYQIYDTSKSMDQYGLKAPKSPLEGMYAVELFKRNGDTVAPLITDKTRLRYLVMERPDFSLMYDMEKSRSFFKTEIDSLNKELLLTSYNDSTDVYKFRYVQTDSSMILKGLHKLDTLEIHTKRYSKKDFPLLSRDFHWIQEYPYNR